MLSGRIRRWNTPVIEKNYAVNQRRLQKELEDWIPEILTLSENKKQSAYALASFDYWHRLRVDQTVSQDSCIAIISSQLSQVFSTQ